MTLLTPTRATAEERPPLWQRLEAMRPVLQESAALLSEAATVVRNAENTLSGAERQRHELEELRAECERLGGLCASLAEEKQRLKEELSSSAEPARLALAGLASRVHALHGELEQTRLSLTEERERRSRTLLLLGPRTSDAC